MRNNPLKKKPKPQGENLISHHSRVPKKRSNKKPDIVVLCKRIHTPYNHFSFTLYFNSTHFLTLELSLQRQRVKLAAPELGKLDVDGQSWLTAYSLYLLEDTFVK